MLSVFLEEQDSASVEQGGEFFSSKKPDRVRTEAVEKSSSSIPSRD